MDYIVANVRGDYEMISLPTPLPLYNLYHTKLYTFSLFLITGFFWCTQHVICEFVTWGWTGQLLNQSCRKFCLEGFFFSVWVMLTFLVVNSAADLVAITETWLTWNNSTWISIDFNQLISKPTAPQQSWWWNCSPSRRQHFHEKDQKHSDDILRVHRVYC